MRILQIYELGPLSREKTTNGVDVAIFELSKHLAKLGHEVSVLCGAGKDGDLERRWIDGVEIIPTDCLDLMRRTWSPCNLRLTRQITFPFTVIRKELGDYDIYHGHIYISGLIANYMARKTGGKAINTIHGSYYPIWDEIESLVAARFYRAFEKMFATHLAKISNLQIHTAGYFAEQVIKWGGPQEKVTVIYNGVDTDMFNPTIAPVAYEKKVPIIFTARRLVKKNGLEYLIKALWQVLAKGGECELLIAGGGPEKRRLESLAESLGIREYVKFLGLLPHHEIPKYLSLADLVVVPSLMEASSLFVLEAMAMEKPVIATRVGGIPEIIPEDQGTLIKPKDVDALTRKLTAALNGQMGSNDHGTSKERIEDYSWQKIAMQTEEAYKACF